MANDPTTMSGVSNPPNGGDVSDISTPDSNDSTVSQTAAPNDPQQAQTPQGAPQGQSQTPPQTPQGNAPQQDQGPFAGKQPNLGKPNTPQPTGPVTPQTPPIVQKASLFHDVAETLAGGPRYAYNVDEYGNMQKTKVPVSNAHLALAFAMQALGGAVTGLGVQSGPNATGRAAAAGFAKGEQQVQQQNQVQKQQATEDFARRAQTTETNMRMYANARNIGRMDDEANDKYIAQYKDLGEKLQKEFPGYVHGPVKYSDFAKYNATADSAIPYSRVPRLDENGKQVTDARGVPQWDIDYLIIDPKFKAAGLLSPDDQKALKEMGYDYANNSLLGSTPLSAVLGLNLKSQAASWNVAKHTIDQFNQVVDGLGKSNATGAPTKSPQIPDQANNFAQAISDEKGVDSRYIKALIAQESGGNADAKSPTGVRGAMQLTSATAKQYGVTDRTDLRQSIEGGTSYFKDLLDKYKDPKLAFAAYYSGPDSIKNGQIVSTSQHTAADTQRYVDQVSGRVGLQSNTPAGQAEEHTSLADWTKDHKTTPADIQSFMGALGQTDGSFGKALQHLASSGQENSASNIIAFLGGPEKIKLHDDEIARQALERTNDENIKKAETIASDKQARDEAAQQVKQDKLNTLETAKIPPNVLQMDPKDVIKNLQDQGVELTPEDVRNAMAIARYEAPINVGSNKLWFKDKSLNQQDLLDVVRQFNPDYNVGSYDKLKQFEMPNSAASKTFQAAAAVSNHLNLLLDTANAVKSGAGQYPLINRLENALNYHTGGSDYSRLAALTNAINGEMGKVLSGGFAPQKEEIDALMKNMTPENSLEQIQKLVGLYTGVMHGKVAPYDEQFNTLSGSSDKHLKNIPQSFNTLLQRYQYETPWAQHGNAQAQTQPQLPGQRSGELPVKDSNGQVIGFTMPGAKGYRPINAQQ